MSERKDDVKIVRASVGKPQSISSEGSGVGEPMEEGGSTDEKGTDAGDDPETYQAMQTSFDQLCFANGWIAHYVLQQEEDLNPGQVPCDLHTKYMVPKITLSTRVPDTLMQCHVFLLDPSLAAPEVAEARARAQYALLKSRSLDVVPRWPTHMPVYSPKPMRVPHIYLRLDDDPQSFQLVRDALKTLDTDLPLILYDRVGHIDPLLGNEMVVVHPKLLLFVTFPPASPEQGKRLNELMITLMRFPKLLARNLVKLRGWITAHYANVVLPKHLQDWSAALLLMCPFLVARTHTVADLVTWLFHSTWSPSPSTADVEELNMYPFLHQAVERFQKAHHVKLLDPVTVS